MKKAIKRFIMHYLIRVGLFATAEEDERFAAVDEELTANEERRRDWRHNNPVRS